MFRAMSCASKPLERSVGTTPRLACVTVSRSRKSAQSMMATLSANWVLCAQASVMRKGVAGSASSMVKRFVSNADGLRGAGVVSSRRAVVVDAAETVSWRRLVYAGELTLGSFFCWRRFLTRSLLSASGVVAAFLAGAGRLRFVLSSWVPLVVCFSVLLRCSLLFRRGSWAGT